MRKHLPSYNAELDAKQSGRGQGLPLEGRRLIAEKLSAATVFWRANRYMEHPSSVKGRAAIELSASRSRIVSICIKLRASCHRENLRDVLPLGGIVTTRLSSQYPGIYRLRAAIVRLRVTREAS